MLPVSLFEAPSDIPEFKPTDADRKKNNFLNQRFQAMQAARTIVDRNWSIYQTMIEAIWEPYPDERSSSEVPLTSALVELFVADALKLQTEYIIKAETSEHNTAAKALDYVWKYDFRRKNRKKEFVRNEYVTAWFGTSVIYTGFESYKVSQYDPMIGDDMELTWKEKTRDEREIIVKNWDLRYFWIDDQAIDDIDQANDCWARQWISYDKFKTMSNNPIYFNTEYVAPRSYSIEYKTFRTQEEKTKQGKFVLLEHYWNIEKDMYMQRANGIIVREHPIMSTINGKKALPFVIRNLGTKSYSIYGRGFCEALMTFNSDVNNLREMLMDAVRRSNSQVLAIGNGLTFNGRSFSYDNEILTFDGNLGANFQQISGNPPNQAIFNYLERLYKDIAIYIGIDIQNILGDPQQTAFQTEVQREASQKRVNVWLMNRDLAFERFANLYKDLLQRFFPLKDADDLYPELEIEDEELVEESGSTEWLEEWEAPTTTKRFRKKKGKSTFQVTPELLRWDIFIDVYTNATAPTISAVDREQKMSLLQAIPTIAQGYAVAKQSWFDLESVLPMKDTLKDLASDYNLQPQDNDDQEDVKAMKQQVMTELQNMMQSTQWGMGQAPEWEPAAPVAAQGQPSLQANQTGWQSMTATSS